MVSKQWYMKVVYKGGILRDFYIFLHNQVIIDLGVDYQYEFHDLGQLT